MNRIVILAVVACALTTACTVRSERTVVERPVPSSTAVVVPDSGPPDRVVVRDSSPPDRVVVRDRY
jgi:hypothetical protein